MPGHDPCQRSEWIFSKINLAGAPYGDEVRAPGGALLSRGQKAANDVGGVVCWDDGAFGGARVDAYTAVPLWDEEPVDYDAAVGSLM